MSPGERARAFCQAIGLHVPILMASGSFRRYRCHGYEPPSRGEMTNKRNSTFYISTGKPDPQSGHLVVYSIAWGDGPLTSRNGVERKHCAPFEAYRSTPKQS